MILKFTTFPVPLTHEHFCQFMQPALAPTTEEEEM